MRHPVQAKWCALALLWLGTATCEISTRQEQELPLIEYECTASRPLEAAAILRWDSGSPVEDGLLTVLQDAFVEAYNDLSFTFCDGPYFRRINTASVDFSAATDNFLLMSLMAECHNCTSSLPLFADLDPLLETEAVTLSKQGEMTWCQSPATRTAFVPKKRSQDSRGRLKRSWG